jgi:hypothetical protein
MSNDLIVSQATTNDLFDVIKFDGATGGLNVRAQL